MLLDFDKIIIKTSNAIISSYYDNEDYDNLVNLYLIEKINQCPDLYRLPLKILIFLFFINVLILKSSFFFNMNLSEKKSIVNKKINSRLSIFKELFNFYKTLIIFYKYSHES